VSSAIFGDRAEAGQVLARMLDAYRGRSDVTVVALPRGGVPVAAPVARRLEAPLDIVAVRKLGVPGHEELAMGAVAEGGVRVVNDDVVAQLEISSEVLDDVTAMEMRRVAEQERHLRGDRPPAPRAGRVVVLVDDGLATGATMHAAVRSCRQADVAGIVVAVPVGAPATVAFLATLVDDLVCPYQPARLQAVGLAYDDFGPVSDEEVVALLAATT
jgi:predicted phosphoribosyltransferase